MKVVLSVDPRPFWSLVDAVNYALNPSFEVNVTDDWTFSQGGSGGSANLDTTQHWVGTASCRIRAGDQEAHLAQVAGVSVPNGKSVSSQVRVRCSASPVGNKAVVYIWDGSAIRATMLPTAASNGAFEYLTGTWLNNSGSTKTCTMLLYNQFNDSAADVWFDGCQIELGPAPTPYLDGSLTGSTWDSTANNSISRRVRPTTGAQYDTLHY